ncbi:MAG: methionine--tRNA ligase [bacterium]|nr:methionine--tRNA ligase [bacterium]
MTTTLPYVNSDPHIGFAMEIIRADVIARWKKLQGFEVYFNTGTDEHGQKIWQKAMDENTETQAYVDSFALKFKNLIPALEISSDAHFIRTTDKKHIKAAEEFWKRVEKNGDIYKKNYITKYCVGCELEKTDSELDSGKCILHPNLDLEVREEENYFFRFSNYQKPLLEFYKSRPDFVIPSFRFNEIKAFVERGLEDFSISRLKSKMAWGVPVPGDDKHVMYVWFDALVSYISTLDWPNDEDGFDKFWKGGTPTQYAGKDNLRQQSAMWQAMLMSAQLPNSYQIVINGFITSDGQKMSKSLGNTIDPFEIVEKFGAETLRYFVCRELSTWEDSDFTWERFLESYNANLANGIGNLTSRIMKMATTYGAGISSDEKRNTYMDESVPEWYLEAFNNFELKKIADHIWERINGLDQYIQETSPFKLIKTDEKLAKQIVEDLVTRLWVIGKLLEPFMPQTSKEIISATENNALPPSLFPRKDA